MDKKTLQNTTKHFKIMKKTPHILLSLLLSTLIFYGGAGVNVFSFCCDECQAKKMNLAALFIGTKKCCCTLSESATCEKDTCCQHDSDDAQCGIDRIAFDWQSASGNQIQLQPLSIELDNSLFLAAHNVKPTAHAFPLYHISKRKSQHPPHLSKNDYFDLLCTLII